MRTFLLLAVVAILAIFQNEAQPAIFEVLSFLPVWGVYAFFYLFGYIGIWYHILSKPSRPQDMGVIDYVKIHRMDVVKSVLAYNTLLILWWTGALVMIFSLKQDPSALSWLMGYSAQSILGHGISRAKDSLLKK